MDAMKNQVEESATRTYRKRYLMLWLLFLCNVVMGFHYMNYSSLTEQLASYYRVNTIAITSLSIMYYAAYFLLFFKANNFIEHYGLRHALIITGFLYSLAASIKCLGVSPHLFLFIPFGQLFAALAQVLTINMSTLLPAVWFDSKQVASATAFAVSGAFVGNAISFSLTYTMFGKNANIEKSLSITSTTFATLCATIFVVILCFMEESPPSRPSGAQLIKAKGTEPVSWTQLFKNKDFVLIIVASSICWNVNSTVILTLNQALLSIYNGSYSMVSLAGIMMSLASALGSWIWGRALDKYKNYRASACVSYFFTMVATLILTYSISECWPLLIYVGSFLFGFNAVGFYSMSFDMVAEFTYPIYEVYPLGVFYCFVSLTTIISVVCGSEFVNSYGTLSTMALLCFYLIIGFMVLFCLQWDLKRQLAEVSASTYCRYDHSEVDNGTFVLQLNTKDDRLPLTNLREPQKRY